MNMFANIILVLGFVFTSISSSSASRKDDKIANMDAVATPINGEIKDPRLSATVHPTPEEREVFDAIYQQFVESGGDKTNTIYSIPTVVHILMEDANTDNEAIGVEQEQIDILNEAMADNNSPFFFNLIEIKTWINSGWFNGGNDMKSSTRVGDMGTLNVWFNNPGAGLLGFATFPQSNYNPDDGVVINHQAVNGGSIANYNLGDTLVHEVGHWMGLYHTFADFFPSCNEFWGDGIDDTPTERSAASGCPIGRDSCASKPGLDPIHNYMDYSYDSCMYEFTPDQNTRMESQFLAFRNTNPLPTCVDSPLDIYINGVELPCGSASCSDADVQSHCPLTCGTCDTYLCADSTGTLLVNGVERDCEFLAGLGDSQIANACASDPGLFTCRDTCGYCE